MIFVINFVFSSALFTLLLVLASQALFCNVKIAISGAKVQFIT